MKKKLDFEKENNKWYVVLPGWTGTKRELQMVAGADKLCDHMANGEDYFSTEISDNRDDNADFMLQIQSRMGYGAFYLAKRKGYKRRKLVWLCPVTDHIFGCYPKFLSVNKL